MSKKKRILIFIDWFLPGYKAGGPIRSVANIVEHLADVFEFYVITTDTDYLEEKPYQTIKPDVWNKLKENVNVFYFSKENLNKNNIKELISRVNYDTAYINGIYSYFFSILPLKLLDRKKKIIIASRGMLSAHAFSSKKIKKKIFLISSKIIGLYKNVIFQTTDQKEFYEVKKLFPKNTVLEIPNLPRKVKKNFVKQTKKENKLRLVSIARISIEKNTLFALEILAEKQYSGEIIFDIFGSVYNNDYWNECKKLVLQMPENITVSHKGSINSELVAKTFANYDFAFMPSKGENFGHSIFEAMSAGCPVIISDQTPWRNLEEKNIGWDIALNDEAKFTEVIQQCIDMPDVEYQKMSEKTYKFAENIANDKSVIEKTRKMFADE